MPHGKNNELERVSAKGATSFSSDTPTRIKLLYDDEPFDNSDPSSISYETLQDLINLPRSLNDDKTDY